MPAARVDDFAERGILFGVVRIDAYRTFAQEFRMICDRCEVEKAIDFYPACASSLPVERRYVNGFPKRVPIGVVGTQPYIEAEGIT